MRISALTLCLFAAPLFSAQAPSLIRVSPLGGQAGSTVTIELLGERLATATSVQFDCNDLTWKSTAMREPGKLSGEVVIAPNAPLGPHLLRITSPEGFSNSVMFSVGQFPAQQEAEPNDKPQQAQAIRALPVEIYGRLEGAPDADTFSFEARQGERIVFDVRSIEDGSAVETKLLLLDPTGRQLAFNDDRDDYNENPRLEHTFAATGTYLVKLDQYRGPRGFNFGKLNSYVLRISSLPVIQSVSPLAIRRGAAAPIKVSGTGLATATKLSITPIRLAEHARMTFPYTMPIRFQPDPPSSAANAHIEATVTRHTATTAEAYLQIPAQAAPGLYRLWLTGPQGVTEGPSLVVEDGPVIAENPSGPTAIPPATAAVTGALSKPGEKDIYRIEAHAGKPLHFATLAAQLGGSYLDSVLTLRDAAGKKLAENDDVVAGQGTLLGNPDSSLFYTPKTDGPLFLEIADRTRRGGPGFEYCLRVDSRLPAFQLFTTPENLTIAQGETAELKIHLVREAGFEGEIDIWADALPAGVTATRGRFRADQLFEPNADGADMIIPDLTLRIQAPPTLATGTYPIRVYGSAVNAPKTQAVEARAVMMLGPILDAWNFIRRPLPTIEMTVVKPTPTTPPAPPATASR